MHILAYLARTPSHGVVFHPLSSPQARTGSINQLVAFCDASFGTEKGAKSRSGWAFYFGGGMISWDSRVIDRVATSSTDAEVRALRLCSRKRFS